MSKLIDQIKKLYENKGEHIIKQEAKGYEKRLIDFYVTMGNI